MDAAIKKDNPNWCEATTRPSARKYWKAIKTDIETLESMSAWRIIDRDDNMNAIQLTRDFEFKRYPDVLINKFKAQLCARGDQ